MSSSNDNAAPPAETREKPKQKHARSRGGCSRCRARRQKCDEQRPLCGRCKEHSIDKCVYTVNLQWGGRSFQSYAKNSDIKKYETEPGTFVYVSSSTQGSSTSGNGQSLISSPAVSTRSLSPLDSSTPLEQHLLHHYANFASCLTSCHPSIQTEFNRLLLPMAMSYPPLLSAVMALSAIHRNTLYTDSAPGTSDPAQTAIVALKTSSISKLRSELVVPSQSTTREAVLATVLTLCMCEIHSGADQPRSWRLHLEGARELLSFQPNAEIPLDPSSPNSLLERWYTSIEALAALTTKGLNAGQLSHNTSSSASEEKAYLDDYFGFSTELVQAFKEIGAAAWERRSLSSALAGCLLSEQDLQDEADILETNIKNMMLRDMSTPPAFYPGVREKLSDEVAEEFYLCNEAYQHAALIHIYRSIRQLPLTDPKVQHSVKRILECVGMITPRDGLSPYIVLTMPLFTAGKEALPDDRDMFKEAITRLGSELKLKNIWKSLEFLEKYWNATADGDILNEGDDHDFIPY